MKKYKLTWLWIYQNGHLALRWRDYEIPKLKTNFDVCKLYKEVDNWLIDQLELVRIFDESIIRAAEATLWEKDDTNIYVKIERIKK